MNLSELKKKGYEGTDVNIGISLFEYGMVWKHIKEDNEYRFYFKVNAEEEANKCLFDWSTIGADIDFWEEFDWINPKDKRSLLSLVGMTEDEFNGQSLPYKIKDLVKCFGIANVFGDSSYSFPITSNQY